MGTATTTDKKEIGDSQIKLLGRWKSEANHRYIKPSGNHLASLASFLAKQGLYTTTQGHRNTVIAIRVTIGSYTGIYRHSYI